jgi:hypothetical protein
MDKDKSMNITNSSFIINSKGASNWRDASNEDVEKIALTIIVNLNSRRGDMVEYSVGYLKVKGLRHTSAQIYFPVHSWKILVAQKTPVNMARTFSVPLDPVWVAEFIIGLYNSVA